MKDEKKVSNSSKSKTTKNTKSTTKKTGTSPAKKSSAKKPVKKTTPKKVSDVKKPQIKKEPVKKTEIVEEVKKVEETIQKKAEYQPITSINFMSVIAVLLGVVLVVLVLAKMYGGVKEIDYNESFLIRNNIISTVNCSDIPNAITGNQSFIYIPNLGTEEEYKLEKKLSNIIKDYNLEDDFYIYHDEENKCGSVSSPESVLGTSLKLENGLGKMPVILYYRDGALTEIVAREDQAMINDGDFIKLLDMYEIKKK